MSEQLTPKRPHPSNRLSRGEVTDFVDAMRTYKEQMEYENEITRRNATEFHLPLDAEDRKLMKDLTIYGNKAIEAINIYNRHHQEIVKRIAEEFRAKNDEEFASFADALESGDYSGLAI